MKNSDDRVAIINSCGCELEEKVVEQLACDGVHVIMMFRKHPERAHQLTAKARAYGVKAMAIWADGQQHCASSIALEKAVREFGQINTLINNLSDFTKTTLNRVCSSTPLQESVANRRRVIRIARAALKYMPSGSSIINIGCFNADNIVAITKITNCLANDPAVMTLSFIVAQPYIAHRETAYSIWV